MIPKSHFTVTDKSSTLKTYIDKDTSSGRPVRRNFCGTCGSPIYTTTETAPVGAALKAALFVQQGKWSMPAPDSEAFEERKGDWERRVVDVSKVKE